MSPAAVQALTVALSKAAASDTGRLADDAAVARALAAAGRPELAAMINDMDELPCARRRQFGEALDDTQVRSKLWLIDRMQRHCPLDGAGLLVLGAWFGVLPMLVNWRVGRPPRRMTCIDRDASVCADGARIIGAAYGNVDYRVQDVHDLDYRGADHADVVVNTICEHLPDLERWWRRLPDGQLVILQSNNYLPCPDHVNCVHDVDEMKEQTPMSEILFAGTLRLPVLDRFMLIGRR